MTAPPLPRPAPRRRRARARLVWALLLVTASATLAAAGAGKALWSARPSLATAAGAAEAGLAAARSGDREGAEQALGAAEAAFGRGRVALDAWYARPALAVPVVAQQLRAARAVARAGQETAAEARVVAGADAAGIRVQAGRLDLDRVKAVEAPLAALAATLGREHARVGAARSPWLLPPLANAVDRTEARLASAHRDADRAAGAAQLASALLGGHGPRRWFLAVQNPAEARAAGGIIGNYGVLVAENGRLRIERFGRTSELNDAASAAEPTLEGPADFRARYARFAPERVWQNVTMSPHFPSVAEAAEGLYRRQGGGVVDGVVSVDPAGLAALLALTGPVAVPGWPEPLSAANAVSVLLHDHYLRFEGDERVRFLGIAAEAVWSRLAAADMPPMPVVVSGLAPAVAGKHILLHSTRPAEQRALSRLGAAGALQPVRSDAFGLVTQNAGANKVDWFLRRSISYRARFDPTSGQMDAVADIHLENRAPASGLPAYVLGGPGAGPGPPGDNRVYLSVYTPLRARAATADGQVVPLEVGRERGRNVYSAYVTVPPGATLAVRITLEGEVAPGPYRLDILRQPMVEPDRVKVEVRSRPTGSSSRPTPDGGPMIIDELLRLDADTVLTAKDGR
ncbi:MAG TPA: DUF4012 domain-containing protein [Acidimicrobiales bacterium]|jgi:hypothetical protein|nr:DUF4012 domain-containing protein [Acidimicrobiales bacterium]